MFVKVRIGDERKLLFRYDHEAALVEMVVSVWRPELQKHVRTRVLVNLCACPVTHMLDSECISVVS